MVMAALKIDNIFIDASIMSIQVKMREVLIVREIEKMSVFSDDDENFQQLLTTNDYSL